MKNIASTIFVGIFALMGCKTLAQDTDSVNRKINPNLLKEDFKIFRTVLENVHPGLYRYTGKKKMDSLFDNCVYQLREPLTEIQFFKLLTPIIASIRDEHTFALPSESYWKNEIGQTLYAGSSSNSNAKFFPFFVKLIDKRLFIDNNLSEDTTLKKGDEILAINDRPISEILAILLPTIPTNGFIESFRNRHLEQFSLNQTYNRFWVHFSIFIEKPDTFGLAIKSGNKPVHQVKVAALPSNKIFNYYWRRYSTINDIKKKARIRLN